MLIASLAGLIIFLGGVCAMLLIERGGCREQTKSAQYDALSMACESEERLAENARLLAELEARPNFDVAQMRRFAGHN